VRPGVVSIPSQKLCWVRILQICWVQTRSAKTRKTVVVLVEGKRVGGEVLVLAKSVVLVLTYGVGLRVLTQVLAKRIVLCILDWIAELMTRKLLLDGKLLLGHRLMMNRRNPNGSVLLNSLVLLLSCRYVRLCLGLL